MLRRRGRRRTRWGRPSSAAASQSWADRTSQEAGFATPWLDLEPSNPEARLKPGCLVACRPVGDCAGSFAGAGWETWSHGHRQSQASPLCCRNSPRSICEASKPSSSTSTASSVSSPRLPSPPRPFPGEEMTPVVQLPLLLVVVVASTGGSWIGGATTGQAYRVQMLALGLIGNQ